MVFVLIFVTVVERRRRTGLQPCFCRSFSSIMPTGDPRTSCVSLKDKAIADRWHVLGLGLPRSIIHRDWEVGWQNCPSFVQRHRRLVTAWSQPVHADDVSVHGASSSCAFCLSSCWHTWDRTTASPLVERPLFQHRASGTSRHSRRNQSLDSRHQACYTQDRSRSDCPIHLGSRKC